MTSFAVMLDFLSLLLLILANGPGFVVGVLGFMNSFIFITIHTIAFIAHVTTQENTLQLMTQKQSNPVVKQKMKKQKSELVNSLKKRVFQGKFEKLISSGIAGIISSIPILGSFIPAHTLSALHALRIHSKINKVTGGWEKEMKKTAQSVKPNGMAGSTIGKPLPAQQRNN